MRIPLDHQSRVPLYKQIESHLRLSIQSGSLPVNTRLPSTRQLADELGVSRITVKNAYDTLASEGLIASQEGSGSYVSPPFEPAALQRENENTKWPLWQQALALEAGHEGRPHSAPARPPRNLPVISFSGVGDPDHYPIQDIYKALQTVIRRDAIAAFEYGELQQGYYPLRETITQLLASQSIQARPENILITSGSQQALALVCQTLLKTGDTILVENPTYNLALELFRGFGLQMVTIPVDALGMQVELLEGLIERYHPRLIYTIPNFQNPTGMSMSGARRRLLISLADRYNIPILEDDFVGDLRYDGRVQPALKTLDPGGRVIYISTFSKMLMPGLRIGFLIANGPLLPVLIQHKRINDLTTSPLIQRAVHEYVTIGRYQTHLRRSCRTYRKRRDAMLDAIQKYLSNEVRVNFPQGGLFVWLQLPETVSVLRLKELAAEEGVEFAAGTHFFANPADGEHFLRLNYATQTPENIVEGIRRLGRALFVI
jgi:GntR family transcriptional regulator/MocR family aminotransferase